MNNLQWLYDTDETFREDVRQDATKWLGSTSTNFAGTWLEERHHEPDEACLLGQHVEPEEVDSREKLEADAIALQKRIWNAGSEHDGISVSHIMELLDRQAAITAREISNDIAIVETGDAKLMNEGITVFGMSLDEINLLRKSKSKQSMMISELESIAEKYREDAIAAQEERDAYRELCGRMRKMANEMLCMEVD